MKIARNKCVDAIRRKPNWISLDHDRELHREVSQKPAAGLQSEELEFSEGELLAAMDSLRHDYREIFVMKHIDNLSYKEISNVLGMTVSAVGEKLYRVRSMLRDRLMETKLRSNS